MIVDIGESQPRASAEGNFCRLFQDSVFSVNKHLDHGCHGLAGSALQDGGVPPPPADLKVDSSVML